jgi:hypothetical protein
MMLLNLIPVGDSTFGHLPHEEFNLKHESNFPEVFESKDVEILMQYSVMRTGVEHT